MQKQKQKATLPKNLREGLFVFIPSALVLKTQQALGLKVITPHALETITLKALIDILESDLFLDYRCNDYQVHEILEDFEAQTKEIIREFKEETKK